MIVMVMVNHLLSVGALASFPSRLSNLPQVIFFPCSIGTASVCQSPSAMSEPPAVTPETSNIYRGLPEGYRTIRFSSYDKTANEMDDIYINTPVQYVMITSINKSQLDMLYTRRSAPYFRADFFPQHQLAVVRLCKPRVLHNGITYLLVRQLDTKAREMGMDVWSYHWGRNMLHITPGRLKCPDDCLFPRWRRQVESSGSCGQPNGNKGKGKWPTVILETGLVESASRLEVDAAWWLKKRARTTTKQNRVGQDQDQNQNQDQGQKNGPNGVESSGDGDGNSEGEKTDEQEQDTGEEQVNIVLLLKIDPPNKTLTIERWENDGNDTGDDDLCQEALTRRIESVTVSRDGISGALHLPFRAVFNREPKGRERDFVFEGKGWRDAVWRDLERSDSSWWI